MMIDCRHLLFVMMVDGIIYVMKKAIIYNEMNIDRTLSKDRRLH